jgi:hypothetical protein
MDITWPVPVALILAGAAYAILVRYFVHRERLARIQRDGIAHDPGSPAAGMLKKSQSGVSDAQLEQ